MNLLEFHEVTRTFGRHHALRQATFSAPAGAITALLGPNGAGKSTALKIALNLVRPSSGLATVLGERTDRLKPRHLEQLGYVADGMELPLWMTVDSFLAWCRPLYPAWDRDLEKSLRRRFELPGNRPLRQLSRGQRMMAALLSNLCHRPKLIVLDEPFSGLDPITREDFLSGLLEISEQSDWAMVLSTHDIEEAQRLADRLVLLQKGRAVLEESAESLLARYRRVEVVMPDGAATATGLPATWLGVGRTGRMLQFTDTAHDPARLAADLARHLPGATSPTARPLTLREIFVSIVKSSSPAPLS